MKHYNVTKVASSVMALALASSVITPLNAAELNTDVESAGAAVAIENYTTNSDNADVEKLLPTTADKGTQTTTSTVGNEVKVKVNETKKVAKTDSASAKNKAEAKFGDVAIAKVAGGKEGYVNVRKKASTESKIEGKVYNNCGVTILAEENGWYKIKSGNCKGYVKADYFVTGAKASNSALENGYVFANIDGAGVHVRGKSTTKSDVVTNVYKNETYAIKKFSNDGKWAKIKLESGKSGWVSADYVDVSVDMDTAITIKEEKAKIAAAKAEAERKAAEKRAAEEAARQAALAEQDNGGQAQQAASEETTAPAVKYEAPTEVKKAVQNEDNDNDNDYTPARKRSYSSSSNTSSGSGTGSSIVAYAKKFVGNPYVFGGSSLTNGTDCSGFTMSVYAHFGYSLNRTSYTQVNNGRAVSLSNLQPGDLLFYKYGGSTISHVAIYAGGGQIVHASNPQTGITVSGMGSPCAARRIV